jgi:hypothetical protein
VLRFVRWLAQVLLCCTVRCVCVLYSLRAGFISECENDGNCKEVVRMIEPKNRQLQAARINIAVQICILHPNVFPKIRYHNYMYNDEKEKLCAEVLISLMAQEPCIRKILSFHYKRM